MSVLVKGFKIPIADEPKTFITRFNDDGTAVMVALGYPQKRYSLVEVPPHGDLIDKKNLSDDLQRRWNVSDDQDFCNKEVWYALEKAPTIIEAEE